MAKSKLMANVHVAVLFSLDNQQTMDRYGRNLCGDTERICKLLN
jgi:hypothetical protein